MSTATGTFTVQMSPAGEPGGTDGIALGRMTLTKQLQGDLTGSGSGQMLTAMTPIEGSAGYVAIEQITGTLHGKRGGLVLQHSCTMDAGKQHQDIQVVPGSGTGELAGISGSLVISIDQDGGHRYTLDYQLPA